MDDLQYLKELVIKFKKDTDKIYKHTADEYFSGKSDAYERVLNAIYKLESVGDHHDGIS